MSGTLPFSSPARFAKANNYWHYQPRIRAGFCTLETPDRCLKDRVHLKAGTLSHQGHTNERRACRSAYFHH
jgi:hypothetical protein